MNTLERLERGEVTYFGEDTESVAEALAADLPEDQALALHGEIGTGKTTFVKGLAKGWGITDPVTSPTFNIFSVYTGRRTLIHLDAYRLDRESQWENLLVEEFLNTPYCLVIEWPENVKSFLPANTWHIHFRQIALDIHLIQLKRDISGKEIKNESRTHNPH